MKFVMNKNKKKLFSSGAAIIFTLMILTGGTFAFLGQSTALNPFSRDDTIEPEPTLEAGANLHDDFAGMDGVSALGDTTKDIYVENTGERNVFVRIRLYEELDGEGAKLFIPKLNNTGVIQGAGNIAGFEWTLGSTTPKDYKSITETAEWNDLVAPGQNTQLVADAYGSAVGTIADTSPSSIPVAGQTQDQSGVISMRQYTALNAVQKAAFVGWIYDVDGFAYWSQVLTPGTATGRLLTTVNIPGTGVRTYTYNIVAEMEYVDRIDIGAWLSEGDDGVRVINTNADGQWDEILTNADGAQIKEGAKAGTTTIEASTPAKQLLNNLMGEAGVLYHAQTGDGTWIEIATSGPFSLIVRAETIGITAYSPSPMVAYADQDIDNPATLRYAINNWYDNTLASDAPLRDYVIAHDALARPGHASNNISDATGFSLPRGVVPSTSDVAFPLSFQEAASYLSTSWHNGGTFVPSGSDAIANFNKLQDGGRRSWLRSPSTIVGEMTGLNADGSVARNYGVTLTGVYARPALWVKSSIFEY